MQNLWSDDNEYQKWLDVELAVCEAWSFYGHIPKQSFLRIKKRAKFNTKEIDKLDIPRTDREQIWPLFQKHRGGFFSGHFHCLVGDKFDWALEESVRIEE